MRDSRIRQRKDRGRSAGGLKRLFLLMLLISAVGGTAGAAVLKLGDILIAEPGTSSVSVVDAVSGVKTTISQGGLLFPANKTVDVALALDGDVIAVVRDRGLIRINPVSGAQSVLSEGGLFKDPWTLTIDRNTGAIYVADSGYDFDRPTINEAGKIIKVDPVTGAQQLIAAGSPCNVFPPANLPCHNTTTAGSYLTHPYGIAIDYTGVPGTLIVADTSSFDGKGAIFRVQPVANGAQTLLWGPSSAVPAPVVNQKAPLGCPMGVAVEPTGNILTTVFTYPVPPAPVIPSPPGSYYGCTAPGIYRIDLGAHQQSVVSANAPAWQPGHEYAIDDMIFDGAGSVHTVVTAGIAQSVAPNWNTTLAGSTFDGSVVWKNAGAGANWQIPFGLSIEGGSSDHTIVVGDEGYSMVFRLSSAGAFLPSPAPIVTNVAQVTSVDVISFTPTGGFKSETTRSNGQPSGVLPVGTTQATLSLTTDVNATCRYSLTAGVPYASMAGTFTTTGALTHSTPINGLANGGSYAFYVRCTVSSGSANSTDYPILFSVGSPASSLSSSFLGFENPLSESGVWDSPGAWADLQKNNGAFAAGLNALARRVSPLIGPDQYSEITYVEDPGSSSWVGVSTRLQSATNGSGYLAIAYSGEIRLYRTDDTGNLNFTQLATVPVDIAAAPRRLRLESQGNTHRVYFNGITVITHNASGTIYSSGQPGIAGSSFGGPQVKIQSFEGGVVIGSDADPPFRSNGLPSGPLAAGITQTIVSLTTGENATCRYSTTAGVAYGSMTNTFSTTGGTAHSFALTGLTNGSSYTYYVRCQDQTNHPNTDDFPISFSVGTPASVTSTFSGIENPLSESGKWDSPGAWSDLQKNDGAFATGLNAQARLVTPPVSANQFSEITYFEDPGSSSWVGVVTRTQSATNGSGYLAIAYSGEVRLYRTDDNGSLTFTQLAAATVNIAAAPRRLRLESQGNTHTVYFNGVAVITHNATGTLYTSGQPGLAGSSFGGPQVKILTFSGGDLIATQSASVTTVAATPNPSVPGQTVTLTATVAAAGSGTGTPAGTVTFKDGTTILGTATLAAGSASLAVSTLAVGGHSVTASYGGSSSFAVSTSNTLTVTVNLASTTTTLTASPNPSVSGQSVTLTAVVAAAAGTPTGTVTFKDGATVLGTATLAAGSASLAVSTLAVGGHSVTASYGGSSSFAVSTSNTLTVTVNLASTTTALTSSANPSVSGQSVTLTAAVAATGPGTGTPTGTVTFKDGATVLGTATLAAGSATLAVSTLAVGGHSVTASYGGSSSFAVSTSNTLTVTVNLASTTTALTSSANPSMFGQSVTLTASVTPVAPGAGTVTGTVTFRDGATVLGTATLTNGSATLATGSLSTGSHSLTAAYAATASYGASTSGSVTQTVRQASTTTLFTITPSTSVAGQAITLTATVTPVAPAAGTPTGTVTLLSGTTVLGSGTLSGGTISQVVSDLAIGSYSFTVSYGGDTNFTSSTSAVTTAVINQASTATTLTASPNPSVPGQAVTLTAIVAVVSPGAGTIDGTVTFRDGTTVLGTVSLVGGAAALSTSSLALGSHSVTASYNGNSVLKTSTSPTVNQTVNLASTSTALTTTPNPSISGQSVTLRATVSVVAPGTGTPTGTVTFRDGTTVLGTGTLSSGVATLAVSSLALGAHSLTAAYGGSTSFATSTSTTLSHTVNTPSTTTGLTTTPNPSISDQSVTLRATVSVVSPGTGTPTGTVTFKDGATTLGTGTLSTGVATLTISTLSVGSHSLTAAYGGATSFAASTSSAVTQTVNLPSTTTALTSNLNPSVYGQSTTLRAVVSPVSPATGVPTGTVTFRDGTTVIATAALSGGAAVTAVSTLTGGSHSLTASYGGSAGFSGSTSATVTQTVNKASTSIGLSGAPLTSVYSQPITLRATINSSATNMTGTVTFRDGTTSLGTGTVSAGVATLVVTTLSPASHVLSAVYNGDTNFSTSTSSTSLNVTSQASTTTSVASSDTTSAFGQTVTFTATVSPTSPATATPSGTVTFRDGLTSLSTVTLASGTASLSISSLSVGNHSITVVYNDDSNFNSSTSGTVTQAVSQAATSSVLTATPNPSTFGQTVTLRATVTAVSPGSGTPTGSVVFRDGTTTIGTVSLSSGVATLSISSLSRATHSITAVYQGTTSYAASTSAAVSQRVQ